MLEPFVQAADVFMRVINSVVVKKEGKAGSCVFPTDT